MNISHYPCDSNRAKLLAIQGTNQSKYLQPDYFLSASQSEGYSRKYSGSISRISRIVSASLLSAMMLTATLDAKAHPSVKSPKVTVQYFNGSDTTKSSTPRPTQDLPKIVGYQQKESFMPSNHYSSKPSSAELLAALTVQDVLNRALSKRRAAIEIEEDEEIDDALEAGAINSNENKADATYSKLSASEEARQTIARNKQAIAENRALLETKYAIIAKARLEQDPDTEIGDAFTSEFGTSNTEQVIDNDGASLALPPPPTEEELALMDESMIPHSNDINTTTSKGQSPHSENYNQTSSSSSEYDTDAEIRGYENMPIKSRNKRYTKKKESSYSYRYIDQGLANRSDASELSEVESEQWDDEWSKTAENSEADTDGYDTLYTSSGSEYSDDSGDEDDLPFPPPPTAEERAELDKLAEVSNPEQTLVTTMSSISSEMQEESEYHGDSDILTQEIVANDDIQNSITEADAASSNEPCVQATSMSQEELLKKAAIVAVSNTQARQASTIASNHIKHRIFARDIVTAAVAEGDEGDGIFSTITGYSMWGSGTFGHAKQKGEAAGSNGYSTKIFGGSIGADINLENDQLLGASFSKFSSRVKYQSKGTNKSKYDTHIFSLYGLSPVSRNMSLSAIGSAGLSKGEKAHSKLLSLESHLNYQIELPEEIKLIPHIGFKYEYERSQTHKEQIDSNVSIARAKKSYQAFSTEIGSRVIFKAIRLHEDAASSTILSTLSVTPTAHFSVERRICSRGGNSPYHLTYQGIGAIGQEIGTSITYINPQHSKTSFNAGIGLIASHKNIKLELLYDHTRQKRFKAQQGMLRLKVSL